MNDIVYDKGRVASFCDAVFSIAMTLLVLEIEIPETQKIYDVGIMELLSNRIPSFIGFFVSFLVTALYWVSHLRIFKYVTKINDKLLWINIFLLLFVVLLPFSTALYVEGFNTNGPFILYSINLTCIGVFNFLLIQNISKNEMGKLGMTPILAKWLKFRSLNAIFVWLLSIIISPLLPLTARMLFVLIFVFQIFADRCYFKKRMV
ncbi:TMEM175 family protein [uncultured Lacinutrix sp.]|uniref:TMEM175 family protein n=1 Tax=uncultured Lacinutrix sp. TaxID=574032 RepID=UPI00262A1D51|nr:TMEM175 family protein [uncultured Lacinutrix sp.]